MIKFTRLDGQFNGDQMSAVSVSADGAFCSQNIRAQCFLTVPQRYVSGVCKDCQTGERLINSAQMFFILRENLKLFSQGQ